MLYTLERNCRVHDIAPKIHLAEAIRRIPENPIENPIENELAALTPAAPTIELRLDADEPAAV